jgi:hypothetical protein
MVLAAPFAAQADPGAPSSPPFPATLPLQRLAASGYGSGIGALAPAMPVPVAPSAAIAPAFELPDASCDGLQSADEGDTDIAERAGLDPCETDLAAAPAPVPGADGDGQVLALGLQEQDRPLLAGMGLGTGIVSHPAVAGSRWFGGVASNTGITYGDQSLTYREADGVSYAVGNLASSTSAWGPTPQLGGVQLTSTGAPGTPIAPGQFGYSSSVGRLDYTDTSQESGGITYGKTAGISSLRYGLSRDVVLEGQMQAAPSLTTMGLGTTYTAGTLGTFQAGATQSSAEQTAAWRYRLGYNVQVADAINLGYSNEQIGSGYSDLASYDAGAAAEHQTRNSLSAGIPVGNGTLAGTYSGLRAGSHDSERRYGLSHTVGLTRDLKLALAADREMISGDYEMTMNLTMPVDLFLTGMGFDW